MDEPIAHPEWVTFKNVKITRYNRTTSITKTVMTVMRDIPENVRVSNLYPIIYKDYIVHTIQLLSFHTRIFTNIRNVRPLNNKIDLHISGIQKTNKCEQILF